MLCSEACLLFSDDLLGFWRQSVHYGLQHDFAWVTGKEDKHKHGIGVLVHKDIMNTVMGCCPGSSRLITIHLRATPFNITIVQVYTPTSDYDNKKQKNLMTSFGISLIRHQPVVQGYWNAKVSKDA